MRTIAGWEHGEYLPRTKGIVFEIARLFNLSDEDRTTLLITAGMDLVPIVWTIPFQRNAFFTGRENILNSLHQALSTGKTVAVMQPQALKGLGGIGKTHTAIEYAYRYRNEYQTILWAPATTSSILQASLVLIATALNLPQKNEPDQSLIIEAVKQWLKNHSGWLLILDNVEDLTSIGLLYPWAHRGHVIITTRSQSLGGIALSITLEKMESEEGALLLLRRATLLGPEEGKEQAPAKDYERAKELSEILGGLPLALDQAAAYIEKTRCGLATYLKLYQIERARLLSERGSLTTDHPEPVTVTFFLAFQTAYYLQSRAQYAAAEPLYQQAVRIRNQTPGPHHPDVADSLYYLADLYTKWSKYTEAEPLYQQAVRILEQQLGPEHPQLATPLNNLAILYFEKGEYAKAEPLFYQAMRIWQRTLGPEHPRFASSLNNLANLSVMRGKYTEAESLYQQAVHIREQTLGSEHPKTADTLTNLAALYLEQDKYAEAEPLFQRALRIREQHLGPEHPDTIEVMHDLAQHLEAQSNNEEARAWYARALVVREQVLGRHHSKTRETRMRLIALLHTMGSFEEAAQLEAAQDESGTSEETHAE